MKIISFVNQKGAWGNEIKDKIPHHLLVDYQCGDTDHHLYAFHSIRRRVTMKGSLGNDHHLRQPG